MAHTIPAERLKEGTNLVVTGKTVFCRLASLIQGAELQRRIDSQVAAGALYPTRTPHTTITIVDPVVLFKDPNNPSDEEIFLQESFYVGKSGENKGRTQYSISNTLTNLPPVLGPNPDGSGSYVQLQMDADLAAGLDVALAINVFKSPTHVKRGLGLQQVIVQEEVKFYNPVGVSPDVLSALGIVVSGPVRSVAAGDATAAPAPGPDDVQTDESGLPMPAGAPSPQENPASVPTPAPAAPVEEDATAKEIRRLQGLLAANANSGEGKSAFDNVEPAIEANPWAAGEGASYTG